MSAQPEIFISYAWGGESEEIVNELDAAFQKQGILLIRDKRDLGFKGMITDFMQKIGAGKAVVTVISDKYLKSPYCMFELLEIYRNLNLKERVFPIVLADATIFDPIMRLNYLKHWQDKKQELDEAIMKFGVDAITVIGDDYKIYKKIFDNFGEMVNILKDINALTPEMHRKDNFNTLIEAVLQLMLKTPVPEQITLPIVEQKQRIDVASLLKDITDRRKQSVLKRLDMLYKLLDDYENKLMLTDSPKTKMACEHEIEKLNEQIAKVEEELG